jgi:hypothetical protein
VILPPLVFPAQRVPSFPGWGGELIYFPSLYRLSTMAPRTNVTQRNNTQSMFNYWLIMLSVAIKPIMLSVAIKLRGLPWQALLANPNFAG